VNVNIGDILGGLAAIITAVILLARAFKTTPHEVQSTDADIISKYEAVVKSSAERAEQLNKRLDELERKYEAEIRELRAYNKKLEGIIQEKDDCIAELRDLLEQTKNELEAAMISRQSRENRILELERKVEQLEGKANE
jgi:iron-sulfur cluster repair protein YtfE (RIC family)